MFDVKAYNKKYKEEHKEYTQEYNRLYAIKNKDKLKEYRKEYHQKNGNKARESNNRRNQEYKTIIYKHYGNKCCCCGENNYMFLNVDHVNNDGYKEKYPSGVRLSGISFYIKIIRNGFPDSYQILCANCNQGKKNNKGVCPHKLLTKLT